MLKIGLTGNIGSGKTTIAKIFESLGINIFYADTEAKKLYQDNEVKSKVEVLFGNRVFNNKQEVDFKMLAEIVFSNKSKLDQLSKILHPMVNKIYMNWANTNSMDAYTIHESAIIFEYNLQSNFDKIVCVSADTELRVKRLLERGFENEEHIRERINNQMSQQQKIKLSDYAIYNNEEDFLIPQVLSIHKELTEIQ